jgi:hypothetical protein
MELEQLKYPVGRFTRPETVTSELLSNAIVQIEAFSAKLRAAVEGLTDSQLDTPYREGGWTIRQVVHHCADSHMNAFSRFKLARTEDNPTIYPYHENLWAELEDSKNLPLDPSLSMIDGIHARWSMLLKHFSADDFARTFFHPQQDRNVRLDFTTLMYAWHCKHHLAHITNLKSFKGW